PSRPARRDPQLSRALPAPYRPHGPLRPQLPSYPFHDPAPTQLSPLSLHDALPICPDCLLRPDVVRGAGAAAHALGSEVPPRTTGDRKSTRLNSSHVKSSYAVFCLKEKRNTLRHHELSAQDRTHRPRRD